MLQPPLSSSLAGSVVIASRMETGFAHRTWSVGDVNGRGHFHAFFITRGTARFCADGGPNNSVDLAGPTALWLPRAMRGEFRLCAGGEGYALSLAEDFVWRTIGEGSIAPPLRPLLERMVVSAADRLSPHLDELRVSYEALIREARELQPGASAVCVAHVSLLLLYLWRAADLMGAAAGARGMAGSTVQRFRQLVELHYRDDLRVDDYARQLGVTRAHLHDACLRATGSTPLGVVHERLTTEACMRLEQTELPVEQVGYSLGFRDPCYFNRFFKKRTGRTPAAFRHELRRRRAAGEKTYSYAAWP